MPIKLDHLPHISIVDRASSTMELARAYSGAQGFPHWIMAREQTAARGRQGKVWQSPKGNLATTGIITPDCALATAANYSFVVALALADTLATYIAPDDIGLKWPNDVLVQGRKCAGILLETSTTGTKLDRLLIGVGVNLTTVPDGITGQNTSPIGLADVAGQMILPEDFLQAFAQQFDARDVTYRTQGFDPIRADWLAQAMYLEQQITARLPHETLTGIFTTIDADGNLVLETAQGTRAITAADVYFEGDV